MQLIAEWLSGSVVQLIDALGLAGIFIGMVLESARIPVPSEAILLSGGAAAAGVLGNLTGSSIAYFVGNRGGRRLVERYGKFMLFNELHFEQSRHLAFWLVRKRREQA